MPGGSAESFQERFLAPCVGSTYRVPREEVGVLRGCHTVVGELATPVKTPSVQSIEARLRECIVIVLILRS